MESESDLRTRLPPILTLPTHSLAACSMADSCRFPVALRWDQGPESLKKLRTKLLLYFQKKSESNGGECEIRDTDCSPGHILIHFKEEAVRDAVLHKKYHQLKLPNGRTLPLTITLPNDGTPDSAATSTPPSLHGSQSSQSKDKDREEEVIPGSTSSLVLIENLQKNCTLVMLNLLLENISGKNEEEDFYVEIIPEIQVAVVTFTCDIDVAEFIYIFSRNPRVKSYKLIAKPLEDTAIIRVENLPEDASQELLVEFFESPKHGEGKVEDIVVLPDERAALITFHDKEFVKRLLKKDLMLSRIKLSTYPYYPSLGLSLYGKDEPRIQIPKPVEIEVNQFVVEYILENDEMKRNIEAKMKSKHCEIQWPDLSCQKSVVKLLFPTSLSSHLRTMASVVPKWSEEVSNEFSVVKAKYTFRDYNISQRAWETIRDHVRNQTFSGVMVKPDFSAGKVFLAGMCKDVTKIDSNFRKMVEETTKKVERNDLSVTENMPLSSVLYQIMCNSEVQKMILGKVPEMTMIYDKSTKQVRLYGLKDEVLSAKCDILLFAQQLKFKTIPINHFLIHFLMSTDHGKLSCLLFVRHNINAQLEVEDKALKLTAYSNKDLSEAEGQIKVELVFEQIAVEDKGLLRSPEWRGLHGQLTDSLNAQSRTVLILECPPGADNDLVISGLSSSVHQCHQQVSDFLEKNTTIQTQIPIKSKAMMKIIEEKKGQIWAKLPKKVNVIRNSNAVCLSGPRFYVKEAESVIKSTFSLFYCDFLTINKPGAKKFCEEKKVMFVSAAKSEYNCMLCLEQVREEILVGRPHFQMKLPTGLTISIYNANLCRHNVDVIVNAANEDLKHIGGLAKAVLDAAGNKLKADSDQIIRRVGQVPAGDAVITDAGNLPCKQVIHAVGPHWDANNTSKCEALLRRAITSSLKIASAKNHSTIAIPAVSSGVFGFPLKLCVENIVEAIRKYMEKEGSTTTLQQIHLVDTKEETVKIFAEVTKAKFGDVWSASPSTSMEIEHVRRTPDRERPQLQVRGGSADSVMTKEGLIITLDKKNIEDCATDVIVNSVGRDLDLRHGAVSKALFNRAGPNMQQLLDEASNGTHQAAAGSVFNTGGCNLTCQEVFHVVTPQWDKGQGTSETILRQIIKTCLTQTEKKRRTSISIPAIGTGNLGFPRDLVASAILDEIVQFSARNEAKNLQEVHLVLHPTDRDTIKAFSGQLPNYAGAAVGEATETQPTVAGSTFFGTVTNSSLGVHEMKIGPITYQVKTGDITKEPADIIVNSSNDNFTLRAGVSKAILEAAGMAVATNAAALGSQANKGYVVTQAGNIQTCRWILHLAGSKDPQTIRKIVLDTLQECENHQAASVAFPALGTGAGGVAATAIADAILDGVVDFVKSKSVNTVQTVKVVVFQQQMLNDFYTSMKSREGTPLPQSKRWYNKIADWFAPPPKIQKQAQKLSAFQLMEGIEPVTFSLCAEKKENVERTKTWLLKQIEYEQAERVITEDCITDLEQSQLQKISDLQKKFQVSVTYKPPDSSIKISGLTRDVLAVTGEIEKVIKHIKDKKHKEHAAELLSQLVEWRYSDQGVMVPFDKMANLELEEAKKANQAMISIKSGRTKLSINLHGSTATDSHGQHVEIERIDKKSMNSLPKHWSPMGGKLVLEVDITPRTPEYTDIQQKFQKSCRNAILKISRVQNEALWKQYQIRKQNIDTKNGSTNNERELFHGTDFNSIQHVNQHGFNRSYAGRNAAAYGNGTYFAINASYSAHNTYSKPDPSGQKHMYLARVLTGVYCVGQAGLVMPPPKNAANPTDLYDSVTDNMQNPSMFVTFHDVQAYPEYHIIFH